MTESKKHHYVPQSLLKNFKYDDNKVFVCDKNSGRIFSSSIIDAGSENYFNTVDRNGERINFESLFQKNDDKLSFLIKKLVERRNVSSLLADEKEQLLSIMVVQMLRTKTYRTSIGEMFEHLNELFSKNESSYDLKKLDENNIRESVLTSLSDFESLIKAMSGKVGLLIQSNTGKDFIISDNPVVRYNSSPSGGLGLSSPDIEIYLPISSDLTFALYCPRIINKINLHLMSGKLGKNKAVYSSIMKGVVSGEPVTLGERTSCFLNYLQVSNSHRFLYGNSRDSFSEFNEKHIGNGKALVNMMGVVPTNKRMPIGDWVVIYTFDDCFMFQIFNVSQEFGKLTFSIENNNGMEVFLNSIVVKEISLFINQNEVSHMKNAKLELSLKDNNELIVSALQNKRF
ncbi:DUF4238 domain-containing protein [Vibrio vulnificus]|nr:DUF4238 domain-containing protein [Vibrio vulnificus]